MKTLTLRRLVLAVLVIDVLGMLTSAMGVWASHEPPGLFLLIMLPVPTAVVGGVVGLRRPDNRVGWAFLMMSMLLATTGAMEGWLSADRDTGPYGITPWLALLADIVGGGIVLVPLGMLYFPDNHLPSPRWRWPMRVVVASAASRSSPASVRYASARKTPGYFMTIRSACSATPPCTGSATASRSSACQ